MNLYKNKIERNSQTRRVEETNEKNEIEKKINCLCTSY